MGIRFKTHYTLRCSWTQFHFVLHGYAERTHRFENASRSGAFRKRIHVDTKDAPFWIYYNNNNSTNQSIASFALFNRRVATFLPQMDVDENVRFCVQKILLIWYFNGRWVDVSMYARSRSSTWMPHNDLILSRSVIPNIRGSLFKQSVLFLYLQILSIGRKQNNR